MTADIKRPSASDQTELDPQALAAIRNLLASEAPIEPEPVEARKARPARKPAAADPAPRPQFEALADAEEAPQPKAKSKRAKTPKVKAPRAGGGLMDRLTDKIKGYRPKPKHIVVAAFALLVLFRPWLMLGVFFLLAFITIGIFLILGYDGFWRQVMRVARWHAGRNPARSAEIHAKLDTFAMKFDAFLDRFPEGSVDGLYLPDFGDLAAADKKHDEALDRRFDSLRESEA